MMAGYVGLIAMVLAPSTLITRGPVPNLSANPIMRNLVAILLPGAWYAFFYQIPFAYISLKSGADVVRDRLNTEEFTPMPENLLTTLATIVSQFYPIFALAFMEGLAKRRGILYLISCLVGVLCVVVNSICFTARDGVLWLLMSLWIAYWIYSPQMDKPIQKTVRRLSLPALAGAALVLGLFTYQRFVDARVGIVDSLITYVGQQPYVFAETVSEQTQFYGLNMRFPMIAEWLGTYRPTRREFVYEWTFGGFAKDFYAINGWATAFVISGSIGAFYSLAFLLGRRLNPIASALLLILYFQFASQGLFYFRLGIRAGNYYILTILMLAFVVQMAFPDSGRRQAQDEPKSPSGNLRRSV